MGIRTKASIAAQFQTGDVPTQDDFAHLIDTFVPIPAAGATGFIEVESTVSSTSRPVGAVGLRVVSATATSQLSSLLGLVSAGALGSAVIEAGTTTEARNLLGITSVAQLFIEASTTSQMTGMLAVMGGASAGGQGTAGLVPRPVSGDAGNFLRADGSYASPAGGGLTLITNTSITATAAQVDFTNGFGGGQYDSFLLIGNHINPATDSAQMTLNLSFNSGAAWNAPTSGVITRVDTTPSGRNVGGNFLTLNMNLANAEAALWMHIASPDASGATHVHGLSTYVNNDPLLETARFSQTHSSAGAVTGIRLLTSTGGYESGRFVLFGIKNS